MKWEFKSLQDMKDFAKKLGEQLINYDLKELSTEVLEFKSNYYSTPSEYLGEFKIVLDEVLLNSKDKISSELIEDINKAIEAINKAFSN